MTLRKVCLLICTCLSLSTAQAAVVTANFSQLAGATWAVDLQVTNDGTPAQIGALTVFFSESRYADLALTLSPSGWDSIVIKPDLAIPSAGFFDTFVLDSTMALLPGQSQGGFRVEFTLLSGKSTAMLPFDVVDDSFQVIESGMTVPAVSNVPEPSTFLLMAVGLVVLSMGSRAARATA